MTDPRPKKLLPELVSLACDPRLDAMTRSWIFDALRDISGESFGDNPREWHGWWEAKGGQPLDHGKEAAQALVASAWLQP